MKVNLSRGKKLVIGIISLVVVIVATSFLVGSMGNSEAKEHINLGNKYMEDLDYEQALAEYTVALEIDAGNEKASLGVETASIKYAEKLLEDELSIKECAALLNVLERSYTLVPRESIENKVMEVKQIISNKEELEKEAKDEEEREKEEKLKKWREEMEEAKELEKRRKEETDYYRWLLLQIYGNNPNRIVSLKEETDDDYIFAVEENISVYHIRLIAMDKITEIGVVTEDKWEDWETGEMVDISSQYSEVGKEYDMRVTDELKMKYEEDEEWKKEWKKKL